jgi:mRNA interferase MazF
MNYRKGDIVLIEFPFSDLSVIKTRPAIVLKDLFQNILIAQITTKINPQFENFEIALKTKDCNNGLKMDSIIRCDLLMTLHKDLIQKKLGHIINKSVISEFFAKLKVLLFD